MPSRERERSMAFVRAQRITPHVASWAPRQVGSAVTAVLTRAPLSHAQGPGAFCRGLIATPCPVMTSHTEEPARPTFLLDASVGPPSPAPDTQAGAQSAECPGRMPGQPAARCPNPFPLQGERREEGAVWGENKLQTHYPPVCSQHN